MPVTFSFPSGQERTYNDPVRALDCLDLLEQSDDSDVIVAVRLNNEIFGLTQPLSAGGLLEPVSLYSLEGSKIYRRSLCFLLSMAVSQVLPQLRLVISHSLSDGYYYYCDNGSEVGSEVGSEDAAALRDRMNELVAAALPIERGRMSYAEAEEYFVAQGRDDTALFLEYQKGSSCRVYRCSGFVDLDYGPLVPDTGCLESFELISYSAGLLLRFPLTEKRTLAIPRLRRNPLLFTVYQEYKSWGKILGMTCVGQLNRNTIAGNIREFVQVAEALHDKKIANIADMICRKRDSVRLVLIAGPSSSGKTTFSKKLAIQLRVLGRNPVIVSLDNYFLPRESTPLDENGNPDFERLEAIDVELLNRHIIRLFEGGEVEIPVYDFITGHRKDLATLLRLERRSTLLLEGIHGLNEQLTPQIARDRKFLIYVSALTQLNLDRHNRISTTDNRLVRRMVRDHQFRGYTALNTLRMWPSVQRGENAHIFPFQNCADTAFNSALDYELAVLKIYAEPLLRSVRPDVVEYAEAARIRRLLEGFLPIKPTLVPSQSILREFIGDSSFSY